MTAILLACILSGILLAQPIIRVMRKIGNNNNN